MRQSVEFLIILPAPAASLAFFTIFRERVIHTVDAPLHCSSAVLSGLRFGDEAGRRAPEHPGSCHGCQREYLCPRTHTRALVGAPHSRCVYMCVINLFILPHTDPTGSCRQLASFSYTTLSCPRPAVSRKAMRFPAVTVPVSPNPPSGTVLMAVYEVRPRVCFAFCTGVKTKRDLRAQN